MATNTQFSIAVHLMIALGFNCEQATSAKLAKSVNTSPSFVRRILAKLSGANLIETTTGKTGFCTLAKRPEEVSLLEIYNAVDAPKAFAIHNYPLQKSCPISCNIESAMNKVLLKTQKSLEETLGKITLAEVISDVKKEG